MSTFTKVTIRRGASQTSPTGGTVIANNVSVQIDEKNPVLASEYDRSHPYDVFDGYIAYYPPTLTICRSDAWVDQNNTDPLTGNAMFYQVIGRPERFPDGHVECVLHVYEGAA